MIFFHKNLNVFLTNSEKIYGWVDWLGLAMCRMTLLLGPPGSGKTTLLLALAGKLSKDLKVRHRTNMYRERERERERERVPLI